MILTKGPPKILLIRLILLLLLFQTAITRDKNYFLLKGYLTKDEKIHFSKEEAFRL